MTEPGRSALLALASTTVFIVVTAPVWKINSLHCWRVNAKASKMQQKNHELKLMAPRTSIHQNLSKQPWTTNWIWTKTMTSKDKINVNKAWSPKKDVRLPHNCLHGSTLPPSTPASFDRTGSDAHRSVTGSDGHRCGGNCAWRCDSGPMEAGVLLPLKWQPVFSPKWLKWSTFALIRLTALDLFALSGGFDWILGRLSRFK